MRRTVLALVAIALVGSLTTAPARAQSETDSQLFLDPTTVPADFYTYSLDASGASIGFTNVSRIQVLPALQTGSLSYLYTPNVDYSATINGTSESLILDHTGPYIVETTSSIDGSHVFTSFGVGFQVNAAAAGPTYNWHLTDTPTADVFVIDPAVKDSQPTFAGGTVVNNLATWNDVLNYLKTLNNAHVELSGHGNVGQFYYNGMLVLDDSTAATQATLNMLKGHVNNLTFMSCLTGQGAAGNTFIQNVANTLGASSGYTDCVGGDSSKWYVNDDGKRISLVSSVPEPSILVLFGFGGVIVGVAARARRSRRAA